MSRGADFGFWPAVMVHDYGGTMVVVIWFFAFRAFAHRWILPEETLELAA